jgi:hypothetical protein
MFQRPSYFAAARGLAGLALAAAFLVAHPPSAGAVLVPQDGGPGTTGSAPQISHCTKAPPATWPEPPRVVIHTKGLTDAPVSLDPAKIPELVTQAKDAAAQIGGIGASSARVTTVTSTSDAKYRYYSTSFGDQVPTIHVGFVSDATITADNNGDGASGLTSEMYMNDNCVPTVTIDFAADSNADWSFSSPDALGVHYYATGTSAPDDSTDPGTWWRPSFLHEMLHAFGLTHTKTAYAMMNHRGTGFPWGNHGDAGAVRPLPDDIRRLRASYPAAGTRWDVDALNGWYAYTSGSKGNAADQTRLCKPSVGVNLIQPETGDGLCGVDGPDAGSTCVRPGETIATRYALNNYSTGSVRVTTTLALSKDDEWDATDPQAGMSRTDDLDATTSQLVDATWSAPGDTGSDFHPIVHMFSEHVNADGSLDPASLRVSWMPLRGTVDVSRYCS